jgi:segregation and condensation protein A
MSAAQIGLKVNLPKFEGPLALLLFLIKKEEMDIFDIEIHRITNQYFEFIRQMKELNLEVAGDFVALAATLIQIKSQLLLPSYNDKGEIIDVEDPRKELVQRLLEYQKFQEAARLLNERPWLGRDTWARGGREKWDELAEEIEIEDNALFSLISSYRRSVRRFQKRFHKVAAKTQSIASRILEMRWGLKIGQRIGLSQFIDSVDQKRRQVLMTFLSSLELAKMGLVRLFQTDNGQEIYIEAVAEIDANSLSNVEEYEGLNSRTSASLVEPSSELSAPVIVEQMSMDMDAKDDIETTLDAAFETEAVVEIPPEQIATDEEILLAEEELQRAPEGEEPHV